MLFERKAIENEFADMKRDKYDYNSAQITEHVTHDGCVVSRFK